MGLKRIGRPVMYGSFAGAALGSLLIIAGWTPANPGLCVFQFAAILGCGIGAGLFISHGPRRALAQALDLIRGGVSLGDLLRRMLSGSLAGLLAGPIAVAAAGSIVGGYTGMAPCHRAPDFITGAAFGTLFFCSFLGLPAIGVGFLVGGIVAGLLNRWQPSLRMVVLATTAVAFILAMIWILWGCGWWERL
jgi:hypothetical protein